MDLSRPVFFMVGREGAFRYSSWRCTFMRRKSQKRIYKIGRVDDLKSARRDVFIIPTLLSALSMPTSARKSSIGAARRAQQRAHLPFRADDLGRGKKTGLPVPTIDHKSDDFEPFDEILSHADTRAAWHGQNKRPGSSKKKRKSVAPIYEDDGGGEMSMELDDFGEPLPHLDSPQYLNTPRWSYRYECE